MSLRSTGIVVSAAATALVLAYANRTISPTPAGAVTSQEQKKPSGQRTRNAARTPQSEGGPGAADHPPVDQSAPAAEPWTAAEIIGALKECDLLLAPLGAAFDISKPIRTAQCGVAAPILLRRVAGVEVTPPTIVNCRVAAKLHEWIETKLQPLAESVLGEGIYPHCQRVRLLPSAEGRQYERQAERTFVRKCVRCCSVHDQGWPHNRCPFGLGTDRSRFAGAGASAGSSRRSGWRCAASHRRCKGSDSAKEPLLAQGARERLRHLYDGSPQANEAHRNHLHLDLAQRRMKPLLRVASSSGRPAKCSAQADHDPRLQL